MKKICDLDIGIYQCITPDIPTAEVILTDERIRHIRDHHPGHFEEIEPFLREAVEHPDYILKDAPHTGLILKRVEENEIRMQIVLRVHTSTDFPGFKNSILSAWKIREKEWRRLLRSKVILYKTE